MAINRLQASLAAATNEVTVAASNVNFDFTLVKYEAPKEYQPLGGILSAKRKHEAETGCSHIIARRLGALFESVCPSTPKLVAAYGTRTIEISKSATDKASTDFSNSIFSAYAGVDATTIWAAATSSKAALYVHLLACLLARVWDAAEATSIWVELVKERRKDIAARLEDGEALPFSLAAAACQQDIPRSQLAEWDASARAWLRTADTVETRRQNQLQLVLKNISLPVGETTAVYSSVIHAWRSALEAMESLVLGMPQAVHDGAAILGLSAWHLYPDMIVFGARNVDVPMHDELIADGGVLSLGLSQSASTSSLGIHWSLSLAHMRYYGRPVRSQRHLSENADRISFPQFQLAAMGAIFGSWGVSTESTTLGLQIFHSIGEMLQLTKDSAYEDRWINMISQSTLEYLAARDEQSDVASRLIHLGRRRSETFLGTEKRSVLPFFGLTDFFSLFSCLKGPEERIALLRRQASRIQGLETMDPILRYRVKVRAPARASQRLRGRKFIEKATAKGKSDFDSDATYEIRYATVFPEPVSSADYDLLPLESKPGEMSHHRWFETNGISQPVAAHEYCQLGASSAFTCDQMTVRRFSRAGTLGYLLGDFNSAAIFARSPSTLLGKANHSQGISYADVLCCLNSGQISASKLKELCLQGGDPIIPALRMLSLVSQVYKTLPEATVAVSVLDRCLFEANWAQYMDHVDPGFDLSVPGFGSRLSIGDYRTACRSFAMAMVAYFEGADWFDLEKLEKVVAISAGDSIYVSMELICDPHETPHPYEIKRILGNVGKAGIVMLVSPREPMVRDIDPGRWKLAEYPEFDGKPDDCFNQTSLHLSFTDYHVPIFTSAASGQQDAPISILESVISVRNSGVWVADVDIIRALHADDLVQKLSLPSSCTHPQNLAPQPPIMSVGCWDDVLDCPDGTFIVKAHGNWLARLAITAVLANHSRFKNKRITVCPPSLCWRCVNQEIPDNAYVF